MKQSIFYKTGLAGLLVGLLLLAIDTEAGRRSLRVEFQAWETGQALNSEQCPEFDENTQLLSLNGFDFSAGFSFYTIRDEYCQAAIQYESEMFDYEYLNEALFVSDPPSPEDEAGLAQKIGPNTDNQVTARRYTFLDRDRFADPPPLGHQWAFYYFPGNVTLVTLYSNAWHLSHRASIHDSSNELIWSIDTHGYDGGYWCFDGSTYVGVWDGEPAGTGALDGCQASPMCYRLDLFNTGTGDELIASPPNSVGCEDGYYHEGEVINLTANPAPQWVMDFWLNTDDDSLTTVSNQLTKAAEPETVSVHYVWPFVCPAGSVEGTWLDEDMESGEGGWTHHADLGDDLWTLVTDEFISPSSAWHASTYHDALNQVMDQSLVSPPVPVPASASYPVLSFFHKWGGLGSFNSRCTQGATLEYSVNDGIDWQPVPPGRFLNGGYTDYVETSNSPLHSSLEFRDAWCGEENWSKTHVYLEGLEGETLKFRFRVVAVSEIYSLRAHWTIDDVKVSGCVPPEPVLTLNVRSSGAVGAPIASSTGHGGTTNYRVFTGLGQSISLLAPATHENSSFSNWTGCDSASDAECIIEMDDDATVSAQYVPDCHALTLNGFGWEASPSAPPSVPPSASPASSSGCPAGMYHAGEVIDLTANPNVDEEVSGWSGTNDDSSVSSSNQLTMPASDHTVISHYLYSSLRCAHGSGFAEWLNDDTSGWTHSADVGIDEWAREEEPWAEEVNLIWRVPDSDFDNDPPDGEEVSDQSLYSPPVSIPAGASNVELVFDFRGSFENPEQSSCNDAGVLEYSTDSGSSWLAVPSSMFLAEPYNGTIGSAENPLGLGRDTWCGYFDWSTSRVDLTGLEGETVIFRFRFGTDANQREEGWWIDRVSVNGCTLPPAGQFALNVSTTGIKTQISSSTGHGGYADYARFVASAEGVVLEAPSSVGNYSFSNWNGCSSSSGTTCNVSMTADYAVTANYIEECYELTLEHTGSGNDPVGTPSHSAGCPEGRYHYYEAINLEASAADGWEVQRWAGTSSNASVSPLNDLNMPPGDINATVHYIESRVCPLDAVERTWFLDDLEAGEGAWTHYADVGTDAWALVNDDYISSTNAWFGSIGIASESDQSLESPEVFVPGDATYPWLSFYNRRIFNWWGTYCYDAGVLEYSTNGGIDWAPVVSPMFLNDPYDGTVYQDEFNSNPLENGREAWCDNRAWTKTKVDLTGLRGESLKFRFRIGTSQYIEPLEGWYLDDIEVSACMPGVIHANGFE